MRDLRPLVALAVAVRSGQRNPSRNRLSVPGAAGRPAMTPRAHSRQRQDDALDPVANDQLLTTTVGGADLVLYPGVGHGFLFQDGHVVGAPCRQPPARDSGGSTSRLPAPDDLAKGSDKRSPGGGRRRARAGRRPDQRSRAAARRSSVRLIVWRLRPARSVTPESRVLNSRTDSGLRSSLHSVTAHPSSVGSMRYPHVE